MKRIILFLLLILPIAASAQFTLALPGPYKNVNANPGPELFWYYDYSSGTQTAWASTTAINTAVTSGLRYPGMTFFTSGGEYWYFGGTANGNLVAKASSGGSYSAGDGLTLTGSSFSWGGTITRNSNIDGLFNINYGQTTPLSGSLMYIAKNSSSSTSTPVWQVKNSGGVSGSYPSFDINATQGHFDSEVDLKTYADNTAPTSYSVLFSHGVAGQNISGVIATDPTNGVQEIAAKSGTVSGVIISTTSTSSGLSITGKTNLLTKPIRNDTLFSLLAIDGTTGEIKRVAKHTISGGGGGVTSVTSADANATVANSTTTPVITVVAAPKLAAARNIATTGDVTGTATAFDGTAAINIPTTVTKINGTALSGLATGIIYNTTSTGVPAIVSIGTVGSSGPATFAGGVLNIPQYAGAGSGVIEMASVGVLPGNSATLNTTNINAIIASFTAGSVFHFANGVYHFNGAWSTITKALVIRGDGKLNTTLVQDTGNTNLITVDTGSSPVSFETIGIVNGASWPITSGDGLHVTSGSFFHIDNCYFSAFYNNINLTGKAGSIQTQWQISHTTIANSYFNGIAITNANNQDEGDWTMNDVWIGPNTSSQTSSAAISWNGSGGGKMVNMKVNGVGGVGAFQYGLLLNTNGGIGTSDIELSNSSFENFEQYAVLMFGNGTVSSVSISNNEFGSGGGASGPILGAESSATSQNWSIANNSIVNVLSGTIASNAFQLNNINGLTIIGNNVQNYTSEYALTNVSNQSILQKTEVQTQGQLTVGPGQTLQGWGQIFPYTTGVDNNIIVSQGGYLGGGHWNATGVGAASQIYMGFTQSVGTGLGMQFVSASTPTVGAAFSPVTLFTLDNNGDVYIAHTPTNDNAQTSLLVYGPGGKIETRAVSSLPGGLTAGTTSTDANYTVVANTYTNLPAATLTVDRTITFPTEVNGAIIYIANDEAGHNWNLAGVPVYLAGAINTLSQLVVGNYQIMGINGKWRIMN